MNAKTTTPSANAKGVETIEMVELGDHHYTPLAPTTKPATYSSPGRWVVPVGEWERLANPRWRLCVEWLGRTGKPVRRYYSDERQALCKLDDLQSRGTPAILTGWAVTHRRPLAAVSRIERPNVGRWWQ